MTQSFWDTEAVEEGQPQQNVDAQAPLAAEEPAAVALSADEFSALEERVLRAVNLVKRERSERADAEKRAAAAEALLAEQASRFSRTQHEIEHLRAERDQVRQRVERILAQLDALEM
jgi:septal ring factor EnvC (AmiA/AmiB activator)